MAFKIVVSEKELSYQLEVDDGKQLNGLKIGEDGSDKNGFAMKKDVDGPRRIKSLLTGGVGYKPKGDGVKRRKTVRGNTISEDIVLINTIVTKAGSKSISDILNPEEEEAEE